MKTPRLVWVYAIFYALILSIPQLVAQVSVTDGIQYGGAIPISSGFVVDYHSHMAKMCQGASGTVAYELLFTHEAHQALPFVQFFYVALGWLANLLGMSFPLMYHVARVLLIITLISLLWNLATRFFSANKSRWQFMIISTLFMGWGWLFYLISPEFVANLAPIEFWLYDAYTVLGALYMPHFVAGMVLQVIIFIQILAYTKQPKTTSIIILTVSMALLALIQPYIAVLLCPAIVLYLFAYWRTDNITLRQCLPFMIPLAIHSLIVLYQVLVISNDPIWANFTEQNITASPPIMYYILGYAPFILPILITIPRVSKTIRAKSNLWLIAIWLILVVALLYAPLPTQRRYLLGAQIPLAIVTVIAIQAIMPKIKPRIRPLLTIFYATLALLMPLFAIISNTASIMSVDENPMLYATPDELSSYAWMRDNLPDSSVTLTWFSPQGQGNGGEIVANTGKRVYLGHWIETADFINKTQLVRDFFNPDMPDAQRQQFLEDNTITHIWFDDWMRGLGTWQPETASYLAIVQMTDTVTIFEVQP